MCREKTLRDSLSFQRGMTMACFGINNFAFFLIFAISTPSRSSKIFDKKYEDVFNMTVYTYHADKPTHMAAFGLRQERSVKDKRNTDIENTMRREKNRLVNAGLFIAAHKYLALDARFKSRQILEERSFFRHFPLPRLKNLHPELTERCATGAMTCLIHIAYMAVMFRYRSSAVDFTPFFDELDLFRYRTTASYFMCSFTLQENPVMKSFYSGGKTCLDGFERTREVKEFGESIQDTRNDKIPFMCSKILFCPDPCYGRNTNGNVPSRFPDKYDVGNPCRNLRHKKCDWAPGENLDFESLIRNRFNITCECERERPGFKWSSRFRMCVDRDECWETSGLCGPDKICQNTVGSYECVCKRGKRLQASTGICEDIVPLKQARQATSLVQKKKGRPTLVRKLEILFGVTSVSSIPVPTHHLAVIVLLHLVVPFIQSTR